MTESETNEKYPYTLGELIGWGGTFTYQGQLYELKNVDPLGSISISYVYMWR